MSILSDYLNLSCINEDTYLAPIKCLVSQFEEVAESRLISWGQKYLLLMEAHRNKLTGLFTKLGLKFVWDIDKAEYLQYKDRVSTYLAMLKTYVNSLPTLKSDLPTTLRYKVYLGRFCLGTISSNKSMTVWTVAPVNDRDFQNFPILSDVIAHRMAMSFYTTCSDDVVCVKVHADGREIQDNEFLWQELEK